MSSSKSKNLKMHVWAATDAVLRSEFNDNFNSIDEAVGSVSSTLGSLGSSFGSCEIYTGEYVGTGTDSHTLHFDRLPDIIFIQQQAATPPRAVIVKDGMVIEGYTEDSILSVSGSSVTFTTAYPSKASLNADGFTYYYAAFCSVK